MIEISIMAFLILAILTLYIHYNIKTKSLLIELLDKEQARKIIENLFTLNQKELLTQKTLMDESIQREKEEKNILSKTNSTLEQNLAILKSTIDSTVKDAVSRARKDSTTRQRAILKGQAMEQLAPYVHPDYQIKDYKFLGDPIDYIIYKGMSEKSEDIEIILLDIKTGTAKLTSIQKKIKKAVEENRVSFKVFRPDVYLEEELTTDD
tara:strand:+ start:185 stop:808 length:624 start_codon:yes stop_codon:yes gene_type:complete